MDVFDKSEKRRINLVEITSRKARLPQSYETKMHIFSDVTGKQKYLEEKRPAPLYGRSRKVDR